MRMQALPPENVFLSNGSDDILNFSFMAFCDAERGAAFPEISYGFYPVYADLYHVPCVQIAGFRIASSVPHSLSRRNRHMPHLSARRSVGCVLKEKLAALYGVGPENVFLSNGSDDILNFSFIVVPPFPRVSAQSGHAHAGPPVRQSGQFFPPPSPARLLYNR